MLREGFTRVIRREHWKFDYIYDWTTEDDLRERNNNEKLIFKNDNGNNDLGKRSYRNSFKNHKNRNEDDFDGREKLDELNIPFDFAKPIDLIKHLISIIQQDKDIIVLDFFPVPPLQLMLLCK